MGEKMESPKNDGEKKIKKKVDLVSPQPKKDGGGGGGGDKKLAADGKAEKKVKKTKNEGEKIKKKVDLVSPQPKKDGGGGGGGDKKPVADGKAEKKVTKKKPADDKKPAEGKKAKESTVVVKMRLCCEGCRQKIKLKISKFKGVTNVSFDASEDLVTVKGSIDVKELAPYLKENFRTAVEVVPLEKDYRLAADGKPKHGGRDKKETKAARGDNKGKGGGGEQVLRVCDQCHCTGSPFQDGAQVFIAVARIIIYVIALVV